MLPRKRAGFGPDEDVAALVRSSLDAALKLTKITDELSKNVESLRAGEPPGKPVLLADRYSGSDQDYQTVVSWTVGQVWEKDHGRIDEISMNSSSYPKTLFRLTVAGKPMFKDLQLQSALTLPARPPNEIARGEVVKVECKSSDGTAIVVIATITGREY